MNIGQSNAQVYRNSVNGGESDYASYGFSVYDIKPDFPTYPRIYNNTVHGGTTEGCSYGVWVALQNSPTIIRNNTINGGCGASSYGVQSWVAHPKIENNIIFTERNIDLTGEGCGIRELTKNSDPVSVRCNDIFDCPAALYANRTETGWDFLVTIEEVNDLTDTSSEWNLDEVLALDSEMRFIGDPSLVFFDSAGIDGLSSLWGYNSDKDNAIRTGGVRLKDMWIGWSIGAYEYD